MIRPDDLSVAADSLAANGTPDGPARAVVHAAGVCTDTLDLGTHRYSGWQVSKESCRDKEGVIKRFAVVAGNPENVCIENPAPVQTAAPETVADARVEIVEYSAKSIAVFGDTKPLRGTPRDLNGLFRAYLTHDGTRCAGWIFSKRREQEVRSALAAYLK